MKLFSLLPKRLVHFACNSPRKLPPLASGYRNRRPREIDEISVDVC